MSQRYSLKTALAATRGALTAANRAGRRYAKQAAIDARLYLARASLIAAERQLRLAVRDALNERAPAIARPVKRRKAA